MSDISRLLRPTIRASQQRKKFADGGVPAYDPMTGIEIGADGPGDDLAARPSAISRGADKFMSRAFGDDIDTYGTGEAPPNGAFDLPSHYGILPARTDGRRYSYVESLRNPVDALANDIRTMRRFGKGLIESTVSGFTAPGDARSGKLPMYDDDGNTSQDAIRRGFDLASMAGGTSAAGTVEGAAARAPGADIRVFGKRLGREQTQLETNPTGAADATATAAAAETSGDVGRGVAGPPGGGEGLREAQLQAERWAGARPALPGLPQGSQLVDGQLLVPGPVARAHDVAEAYMAGKDFGYPHPDKYHPIDTEHASAIAKAFEEMPHAPNDPQVIAAYEAMIAETLAQYQAIRQSGLKLTPTGTHDYPYTGNPRAVVRDVADNNHMAFFKTDEGFGSPTDLSGHPMLRPSGEMIGDHALLNNDLFRIVHDYMGHVKNGYGFRAAGEDNAYRAHASMYSPLARRAMTTETRGQNSWLNYGPHGDHNRTASATDTIYAPQKVGLLPEWTMYDRAPSGTTLASDSGKPAAAISALEHAKPFYTSAEPALQATARTVGTGAQWANELKRYGAKPEELDWRGVTDLLAQKANQPITRAELESHIGSNTAGITPVDRAVKPWKDLTTDEQYAWMDQFDGLGQYTQDLRGSAEGLYKHEIEHGRVEGAPKWGDYQLPGAADSYRERLLTLPDKTMVEQQALRDEATRRGYGSQISTWPDREFAKQYREKVTNAWDAGRNIYRGPHFSEPNNIVHRRSTDRIMGATPIDDIEAKIAAAYPDTKRGSMGSGMPGKAVHDRVLTREEAADWSRDNNWRSGFEDKPGTGVRSLHAEEIQSDLHQTGRREGYHSETSLAATRQKATDAFDALASKLKENQPSLGDLGAKSLAEDLVKKISDGEHPGSFYTKEEIGLAEKWLEAHKARLASADANRKSVPDLPFKETWHKLAMHDMIREAAEKGYDRISWTGGRSQPTNPKNLGQPLSDAELAKAENGLVEHYDTKLVNTANKIGKAHGVTVQKGSLPDKGGMSGQDAMDRMGIPRNEQKAFWDKIKDDHDARENFLKEARDKGHEIYHMDVPQSLKDEALKKGFSLFEDSGAAGKPIAAAGHINTPQFREWFGDSQAVAKDGKPLTLYHGTPNHEHAAGTLGGFDTFDRLATSKIIKGRTPGMDSVGSWFSDLPTEKGAAMYSGGDNATKGSIYPVHLRIEHPWEPKDFNEFLGKMHEEAGSSIDAARKKGQPLGRVDPEPLREWLQSEGYDGIKFPKGTVDGKEQSVWIALEPNQIKSATGNSGEFSRSNPSILREDSAAAGAGLSALSHTAENARISTRLPTGKKNPENALADDRLKIDMAAMEKDPGLFAHNVGLVSSYPNLLKKETRGKPTQVARRFIDYVSDNLLHLYDQVPENIRGRSKKWYEGGNKIVNDFATEHNTHPNSSAGVVAALSPQKDWFQNVDLARRVHDIHFNRRDVAYDPKMETTSARIFGDPKFKTGMERIRGKTYGELDDIADKAMWLRLHDEAHNPRSHRLVTPEGEFGDVVRNANGAPSGTGWGSLTEIGKAIQSLEANGDVAKISGLMGERHKVRNFYNNLIDPHSPHGDVTIDTHAVAAGLMRPLSGNSMEVAHNFGNYPGAGLPTARSSAVTGVGGTYGLYADAYRKAAEARGVTPREMQSVTWEAIRGLFKDTWKSSKKNTDAVDAIWRKYQKGLISKDDARTQISTLAGGIDPPSWHEPAGGRRPAHDEAGRNSADPAELPGNGVPGGDAAAMVGGAGSGAAPGPAPSLNPKKRKPRSKAEGGAVGDDYNTPVPDEAAFQQWKALNAPDDSGIDYDLRGAYLANMQRAENGHMGDQYKKPNHPTFSDQSQYAVGDQRGRMGYWVGDTFVPPAAMRAKGGRVGYEEGGDVDDGPRFDPTRLAAAPSGVSGFNSAKLKAPPMSATDVFSGAVENAPGSAWQFVKDIVRPITHPIETATGIKDLGLGLLEKSGAVGTFLPPTGGGHEKYADAMMDYIKNRYGGVENIKKSIAKDPVGVLSDASMILTGGGSAAARLPGVMGKTGEIISSVGRAVDPLMAPINAAKVGTKVVGETLTHTGATPLENAYKAGVEGGDAGEVFRSHMRGTADSVEPVEMAKRGLAGYRAARGAAYREGMGDITSIDRQMGPLDRVLDFGKIENAVDKTERLHRFGVMDINQPAAAVRSDMMGKIAEWKALPPLEYHTLEGLDALKKSLGQVMMATEAGTPARTAAGEIYNAVRKTIVEYDPKYAKVMEDYEKASTQIKELEKAMSLGQKATADTALRKLQSIMRNNVNTNYGRRLELGKLLEENGATHLMAALSGQSLSAWAPRGLGKLGAEFALLGSAGHFISPWTLAAAPLMSPRIMGEVSHGVGRTVGRGLNATNKALSGIGGNRTAANASYRLGRATNPYENEDPANPYAR